LKRSAQHPAQGQGAECAIAPSASRGSGVSGKRNGDGDVPHLFRCLWKTNRTRERPGGLSLERR